MLRCEIHVQNGLSQCGKEDFRFSSSHSLNASGSSRKGDGQKNGGKGTIMWLSTAGAMNAECEMSLANR